MRDPEQRQGAERKTTAMKGERVDILCTLIRADHQDDVPTRLRVGGVCWGGRQRGQCQQGEETEQGNRLWKRKAVWG